MCYSIKVQQELDALWSKLKVFHVKDAYECYERMSLLDSIKYKPLIENTRIFPYYFVSVVYRDREGVAKMEPMRY